MKLFSSGKISHRILSMCLAVCMLFSLTVTVAAADNESADLTSLSLSGVSVIEFDPDTVEYTAYIPCDFSEGMIGDGLTVPEVYYEKASADADVVVAAPDTIGADSAITVTVTNGGAEKVYTINLVPIGQNMFANGGFESGENTTFISAGVSVEEEAAYTGNYGLQRYVTWNVTNYQNYYTPYPSLVNGKTYLTSMMAKVAPAGVETSENNDAARFRVADVAQYESNNGILNNSKDYEPKTIEAKIYKGETLVSNYANTPSPGASVMSNDIVLGRDWTSFSAVVTPRANIAARVELTSKNRHTICYTDDYYMGELVVSSANMTDRYGEVVTEIIKPFDESEVETVALTANFYNQLGKKVGLDALSIEEFVLAENYEDVTISEEGVLSVGCNAPDQIKIITYAVPNLGVNHVQSRVKAEVEIELIDISDIPLAEVTDVKIKNMSVPSFNSKKFVYSMHLPYTYEESFPERTLIPDDVTTFVADEETTCEVTVGPGERDEDYLVTIDATLDDIETQYTVKVYLVGDNLLADGGLEDGNISIVGPADGPTSGTYNLVEDDVAAVGSYALKTTPGWDSEKEKYNGCTGWGFVPRPSCDAGVTYITSYMCRLTDPEGATYSLMNWSSLDNSVPTKRYDIDGMEQITKLVPVTPSWQKVRSIMKPSTSGTVSFCLVDPTWAAGSQPSVISDEHYIGELVVGSINYKGATQIAIPETGENSYELKAEFFNQFGDTFGLGNETVAWDTVGKIDGVRVEGGKVFVTNEAVSGNIRVRASIEPTFNSSVTYSNSFELELIPESDTPEIPRADDVKASGVIKTGETITGSYDYYNALSIDEGATQCRWLYADTKTGAKTEIPADYDLNEDGDATTLYIKDNTYDDKYIFFEVTPYTVEGEHGEAVVSNYVVKPTAPTVPTITITGNGYVGSTAVATYEFVDENGDEEDGTTYRWLRGNSLNGTYAPIEDEEGNYYTEKEYTITTADIGKYLRFEVTPKTSAEYEPDGLPTVKNGVLAAAKPEAANVKIENVSGNKYRVDFLYSHRLGIPEGVAKVQWYADGVDLGTGISKTVDGSVNTITVRVIPVASKPPYDGEAVTETLTLNNGGNVVNKRPSDGEGTSSSIGSSIVPAPEVTPVPEQKPVEEAPKHWAADGIEFVINNGIMQEITPGDFQNSRIVTRADFIYYVMKTLGSEDAAYAHEFADVTGDDYFAGALQSAVNSGIISKDANFNPQRSVSRQEVCKILVLAASLKMQQVADLTKFADEASVSEWARGYVGAAVDSGLLKGVSENEFSPLGAITREQTAVILKRLDDYRKGGKLS